LIGGYAVSGNMNNIVDAVKHLNTRMYQMEEELVKRHIVLK